MNETVDPSELAGSNITRWRQSPLAFVTERFKVKPDPAQEEALRAFPHTPRIAMQACTGSGKTAVLAWLGWNFLVTRPHPMIGATSISGDNLKTGLWTELARWRSVDPMLTRIFEQTKTSITSREFPDTWKMEARTWSKDADQTNIGNSLRGVHSEYVMWLLDESGGYPDAILPTCEAIFSGNPKEAHIVQAGNPIRRSGPLWKAASSARASWKVIEITADPDDPNRTPRVSPEHARQQIQDWGGRDSPYVMVNILGKFPPTDFNALIGPDEVTASFRRFYREHEIKDFPRVMGIDVALEGDDQSVIFKRQGIQSFPAEKRRGITPDQGAGLVSRLWDSWNADAAFVDNTGGFGSGWISHLRQLGKAPIGVQFAGQAHEPTKFFNKRTEMYFDAINWIKEGGALVESPELLAALTQTTYTFKGDRLLLEPKAAIKKKLGYSPDEADAFVLTFAEPVNGRVARTAPRRGVEQYDPFKDLASAVESSYDPFNN